MNPLPVPLMIRSIVALDMPNINCVQSCKTKTNDQCELVEIMAREDCFLS